MNYINARIGLMTNSEKNLGLRLFLSRHSILEPYEEVFVIFEIRFVNCMS